MGQSLAKYSGLGSALSTSMEEWPDLYDQLPEEDGERTSVWKIVLVALAIGPVLLIALGLLRYWMVGYYGGG